MEYTDKRAARLSVARGSQSVAQRFLGMVLQNDPFKDHKATIIFFIDEK
jgi:hypothetical protein